MESPEAGLTELGKRLSELLEEETNAAEQIRRARGTVLEHVAQRAPGARFGWLSRWRERARPAVVWSAAAAIGLVGLGLWLWTRLPISFEVGGSGRSGDIGELISAGATESVPLTFSEGSSVVLRPGGRVRVLSAASNGARVLVESGAVDVAITHRGAARTQWTFEAGSLHVRVTGTRFHLAWNPQSQAFVLATKEGSVEVSGACVPAARAVKAGERLDVTCASPPGELRPEVAGGRAGVAAPPAAVVQPSDTSAPSGASAGAVSVPVTPATPPKVAQVEKSWRELLAAGQLGAALTAAERADFTQVCRGATAAELLALSDAARFAAKLDEATLALTSLRQRFPGSPNAATAAFALGRIAFERRGAYGEAARWFSTYLEEAPSGPLMGDAVGRLMEARHRQGDKQRARLDAERYLRRFPDGPYAAKARRILMD